VREALQWWRNLTGHARTLLNAATRLSKGGSMTLPWLGSTRSFSFSASRLFAGVGNSLKNLRRIKVFFLPGGSDSD